MTRRKMRLPLHRAENVPPPSAGRDELPLPLFAPIPPPPFHLALDRMDFERPGGKGASPPTGRDELWPPRATRWPFGREILSL